MDGSKSSWLPRPTRPHSLFVEFSLFLCYYCYYFLEYYDNSNIKNSDRILFPKKLRSRVKRCYEVGLVINWGHAYVNKLSRAKIKQIKQWTVHVPSASGLTPKRQCMADVYVTQDEIQPKFFLLSLTICDSSSSGIFYPVGVKTWIVIIIFYEFIYLLSSIVLIFWVPNQSEIEKFIPKMSPKARWKRKTHENTRKRKKKKSWLRRNQRRWERERRPPTLLN